MNRWILPRPLMSFVLKNDRLPVAGLRVAYKHPAQKRALVGNVERDALRRTEEAGFVASLDHPAVFFLHVLMPCGFSVFFKRAGDVPLDTVPCPCGDVSHYLVFYERIGQSVALDVP